MARIARAKTDAMFETASRHHKNELRDPNWVSLECSWVEDNDTGEIVVYAPTASASRRIKDALREEFIRG